MLRFMTHALPLPSRTARLWPWMAAFVPAVVILVMLWPLRVPLPYLDGWAFVKEYQRWAQGDYSWGELFAPHYIHPSAVGKVIYFSVLHWLGGNMGVLPLLMWAMAVGFTACVCHLARPLWRDRPAWGAVLMLLVGLTVFSAGQGEVWLWGFLFQNSVPGVCLLVGLVVLSREAVSWRSLSVAALMVVIASYSFGSGPLVGLLLALVIWHGSADRSRRWRIVALASWLVFTGLVAWSALRHAEGKDAPINLGILLDRPVMRLHFVLILLGQLLGKGTAFEPRVLCAVMGTALAVLFTACSVYVIRRRQDRALVTAALPWLVCCLFGLGTAVLICLARSFNSVANALDERYAALAMPFTFGVILLAVVVVGHAGAGAAWIRFTRAAAVPALVVFLLAQAVNWQSGWHAMKMKSKTMEQERAMLAFVHVLPPDADWTTTRLTRHSALSGSRYLGSKGRLRGVEFVPGTGTGSFTRGSKAPKQWANIEKPMRLEDGSWRLRGLGGLSWDSAADLVVITAQSGSEEERIIGYTAPFLPDRFFEREAQNRRQPELCMSWKYTIPPGALPSGSPVIRAYVYETEGRKLRRMDEVPQTAPPAGAASLVQAEGTPAPGEPAAPGIRQGP